MGSGAISMKRLRSLRKNVLCVTLTRLVDKIMEWVLPIKVRCEKMVCDVWSYAKVCLGLVEQ
jgi:hypothetical protein